MTPKPAGQEKASKHSTAIYPDPEALFERHMSLPFECDGQDCMTKDGFLAALAEAGSERWISVEERMPEPGDDYLVFSGGHCYKAYFTNIPGNYFWDGDTYGFTKEEVTHWQPLPQPPKGDEMIDEEYYIQDTRNYVGNSVLWWRVRGEGYTTNLAEAMKVPATWVGRPTDKLWLCSEVDKRATRQLDMQLLRELEEHP